MLFFNANRISERKLQMSNQLNDTRLSASALEAAVDYAYGGAAVRVGRQAQAQALACLLRRKAPASAQAERVSTTKA